MSAVSHYAQNYDEYAERFKQEVAQNYFKEELQPQMFDDHVLLSQ